MKEKKPDQVVYNQETQQYDAAIKPYATNVGAPAITASDNSLWKVANIHEVNTRFEAKFQKIHSAYNQLLKKYERNQLVYAASFSFKPLVGQAYHLYRDSKLKPFLSIIGPNECNFDFIGSYRFGSDKVWEAL